MPAESKRESTSKENKAGKKGSSDNQQKGKSGGNFEAKKAEFFKNQLIGIESRLKDLNEKHKKEKPKERDYIPMTYNTLSAYGNTHVARYAILGPEDEGQYINKRNTAIQVIDPWVSLDMDVAVTPKKTYRPKNLDEEAKKDKEEREAEQQRKKNDEEAEEENAKTADKEEADKDEEDNEKKEGEAAENENEEEKKEPANYRNSKKPPITKAKRELTFSDVPLLRKELREKYSMGAAERMEEDRRITTDHYNRSKLYNYTKLREFTQVNMRSAIFAYSQNTEGSKQGIKECIKETDKQEKEEKEETNRDEKKKKGRKNEKDNESQRSAVSEKKDDTQRERKASNQSAAPAEET